MMTALTATTYGGDWFINRRESTGTSLSMTKAANLLTTATILCVGTGGAIDLDLWKQRQFAGINPTTFKIPINEFASIRTAAEDLAHVRNIFAPAVSDLANALGVSRQAIYNWANGEQPKQEHLLKLRDLAQAADVVAESGIPVRGSLLKRKVADGKNLLEVAQAGGSVRDAAQILVRMVRREAEQRDRMNARFATRDASPRSVESDFPAVNDLR